MIVMMITKFNKFNSKKKFKKKENWMKVILFKTNSNKLNLMQIIKFKNLVNFNQKKFLK